jgi:hypothetical protein
MHLWTMLENAGLPVSIVGGSDHSCISVNAPGEARTMIPVGLAQWSYQTLLDGIKSGTAVVSRGAPADTDAGTLRMTNNVSTEYTVAIDRGKDFVVTVEVARDVQSVTLLLNGKPATSIPITDGKGEFITWGWNASGWLSARTDDLQTQALRVRVDGATQRDQAAVDWLHEWVQRMIDAVSEQRFTWDARQWLGEYQAARAALQ